MKRVFYYKKGDTFDTASDDCVYWFMKRMMGEMKNNGNYHRNVKVTIIIEDENKKEILMSTLKIKKTVGKTSGVTALVIDLISPRKAVQQMVLKLGKGIDYKDITSPQDTIPQIEIKRAAPKPKKAGAKKVTQHFRR